MARREVRSADPPGPPLWSEPTDDSGEDGDGGEQSDRAANPVVRRLRHAAAWQEWCALGLDPAHDGPDRVEVHRAKRVDPDQPPLR